MSGALCTALDCMDAVRYLDSKGYVYCDSHKIAGRGRKLRAWELRWLAAGRVLPSYRPLAEPAARKNPLLVAFREAVEHSVSDNTVPEIAADWVAMLEQGFLGKGQLAGSIPHARLVLQRLAAL